MSDQDDATIISCPHCDARNRVRPTASDTPRCAKCHEKLPWVVTTGESGLDREIDASAPVLVDFWAPWCGPCRQLSPVVEAVAARYAGRLKLVKVNIDDNPRLASRFSAMSIPLLVLFSGGKEVDRQVGAVPESHLVRWLEPHLSAPC